MSEFDLCSDDGDVGGPTSHRYLYEIDREELFSKFVGAVGSLRVDADGVHCWSAEAQGLSRMARAVQTRTDAAVPREAALGTLAMVLRVLLSATDARDRGEEKPDWHMSLSDLVEHFLRLRDELRDMLPAPGTWRCPVAVPDDLSGMDAITAMSADDEVSEGEDIATVEGGYVWHTDGRPPEVHSEG